MTTPTTDRPTKATDMTTDGGQLAAVGDTVSAAAETVKDTAADAVARLPEVAATTRAAIEDANRQISAGSDEMLAAGSLLSFGFAMGLLIGGANRFLVGAALVPGRHARVQPARSHDPSRQAARHELSPARRLIAGSPTRVTGWHIPARTVRSMVAHPCRDRDLGEPNDG